MTAPEPKPPAPDAVPELARLAEWNDHPRYLAYRTAGYYSGPYGVPGRVHTYKTIRGARKLAGRGGLVLVLDLLCLPVVTPDQDADQPGVRLTELEFAERQMLLWGERAAAIQRAQRADLDGKTAEAYQLTLEAEQQRKRAARERAHRRKMKRKYGAAWQNLGLPILPDD